MDKEKQGLFLLQGQIKSGAAKSQVTRSLEEFSRLSASASERFCWFCSLRGCLHWHSERAVGRWILSIWWGPMLGPENGLLVMSFIRVLSGKCWFPLDVIIWYQSQDSYYHLIWGVEVKGPSLSTKLCVMQSPDFLIYCSVHLFAFLFSICSSKSSLSPPLLPSSSEKSEQYFPWNAHILGVPQHQEKNTRAKSECK